MADNTIDFFELKSISFSEQKVTEWVEGFVKFYDTHIQYFISFYADEPKDCDDKGLGEENVFQKIDIIALRQQVVGVKKRFIERPKDGLDDIWKVSICLKGFNEDIRCYTETESEAEELRDKVLKYLHIK